LESKALALAGRTKAKALDSKLEKYGFFYLLTCPNSIFPRKVGSKKTLPTLPDYLPQKKNRRCATHKDKTLQQIRPASNQCGATRLSRAPLLTDYLLGYFF